MRRSNAAHSQVSGAREGERRCFRFKGEAEIEHGFVANGIHGDRLEKQVHRCRLQATHEVLPKAVTCVLWFHGPHRNIHFGQSRTSSKNQGVDAGNTFIAESECAVEIPDVMDINGHKARPSAAIESQPNFSDGRNLARHRSFHLDAEAACPFDVDGTKLMVEQAAFLELSLVPVDFLRVVKNILLSALAGELEFTSHQK